MAFYKLPSTKNHSRFVTAFWSMVVQAVFAIVLFYPHLSAVTPALIWTALLWGATFTSIVLLQMYALNHVDTNVLFPVTTTASLIITVLAGVLIFSEHPTSTQLFGIILAVITIFSFLYRGGRPRYSKLLIAVGSGIVFISAFNKVLQKVVAESFSIQAFQIYQYLFAALFALLILSIVHREDWKIHFLSGGLKVGSLIGLFGFWGGYSLYVALTKGPFPLITSIHSLYVLITALVAYFLFKEQLTVKKILLLFLAVIAVILIRIG